MCRKCLANPGRSAALEQVVAELRAEVLDMARGNIANARIRGDGGILDHLLDVSAGVENRIAPDLRRMGLTIAVDLISRVMMSNPDLIETLPAVVHAEGLVVVGNVEPSADLAANLFNTVRLIRACQDSGLSPLRVETCALGWLTADVRMLAAARLRAGAGAVQHGELLAEVAATLAAMVAQRLTADEMAAAPANG